VMVLGAKEKFLIVMASFAADPDAAEPDAVVGVEGPCVDEVALVELEHAARTSATPMRMAAVS